MKKSFFLMGFFLIQFLFFQPVFAQGFIAYDYLMELGVENFDYGDYQEALHYFKKAKIINLTAKEPKRYIRLIKDIWEKEKIEENQKNKKIVTIADLYKWERGLENFLEESAAQHRKVTDALGKQIELFLRQNQNVISEIFELRTNKQILFSEIAGLKTEIKKLAGQINQNQVFTIELFELREVNQNLYEEIASLEKRVEKLGIQRREDQANFYKQLKEEIAGVRQRYTQRLKDVQHKLEKANFEREKIYKQKEEMIAKIEEKGLKILEEKVQREAEEEALDKYEKKAKKDKKGEKN